jgi:hypothetical protein
MHAMSIKTEVKNMHVDCAGVWCSGKVGWRQSFCLFFCFKK